MKRFFGQMNFILHLNIPSRAKRGEYNPAIQHATTPARFFAPIVVPICESLNIHAGMAFDSGPGAYIIL